MLDNVDVAQRHPVSFVAMSPRRVVMRGATSGGSEHVLATPRARREGGPIIHGGRPMRRLRPHLTYANVMATLLAIGALTGGTAYAADTIGSSDIIDGQVRVVRPRQRPGLLGGRSRRHASERRAGQHRHRERPTQRRGHRPRDVRQLSRRTSARFPPTAASMDAINGVNDQGGPSARDPRIRRPARDLSSTPLSSRPLRSRLHGSSPATRHRPGCRSPGQVQLQPACLRRAVAGRTSRALRMRLRRPRVGA